MIFSIKNIKYEFFFDAYIYMIKTIKLTAIILLFVLINNQNSYSNKILSNYDLIVEMSDKLADTLFKSIIHKNYDSISIKISDFPAKSVLEKSILEKFISSNIIIFDDTTNQLNLIVNRFDISYQRYEIDEDSLKRQIMIDCFVKGTNFYFKSYEFNYIDKISRDDVPLVEISGIDFTKPALPPRDRSFYKSFFEPAILATSAILTVIILFSVRSK